MHAFTAFVDTSSIPQAGFGSFLIFQGTYKRKAKTDPPGVLVVEQLPHLAPFTTKRPMGTPATKVKRKGSVRPTGYNIEAECRTYWSTPLNNNDERVFLQATLSPWEDCDGFAIRTRSSDGDEVVVCTYEADRDCREFISERPICLGLYGPLDESRKYFGFGTKRSHHVRVVDVKPDSILNVKSYIFCGEPNEWAFHTDKQRQGEKIAVGKCSCCTIIRSVVHMFIHSLPVRCDG